MAFEIVRNKALVTAHERLLVVWWLLASAGILSRIVKIVLKPVTRRVGWQKRSLGKGR